MFCFHGVSPGRQYFLYHNKFPGGLQWELTFFREFGMVITEKGGVDMPSSYAHYRFGTKILPTLPADIRRSVQRFRRMYDVGLHGPDIFYFYNPISKKGTGTLGIKYHEQTGKVFFTRICRGIRMEYNEAAAACLYGVLCHYVLDSVMHPAILEAAQELGVTHIEIETEFDRFLLEKDHKAPSAGTKLSQHLSLTDGECETLAKFYPPSTGKTIKRALGTAALSTRLLYNTEGFSRKVTQAGIGLLGKELQGMMMTTQPNPKCRQLNEYLYEKYQQAMAQFPVYLQQLQEHMTYSAPLAEEFAVPFV
jgi:hypothetical protein